jgi:hypothetical protein
MDLLNVIHCIRDRAHLAGADAVILDKEAHALLSSIAEQLPDDIDDCNDIQLRAALIATQAHKARQRYFRELQAINILLGRDHAHFAGLG